LTEEQVNKIPVYQPPFQDQPGLNQHEKGQTNLDINEARDDTVAVASAGPHAN